MFTQICTKPSHLYIECNLPVHQGKPNSTRVKIIRDLVSNHLDLTDCYGIDEVPSGSWYCERCEDGVLPSETVRQWSEIDICFFICY